MADACFKPALAPKPHAQVSLRMRMSGLGVLSIRFAGFAAVSKPSRSIASTISFLKSRVKAERKPRGTRMPSLRSGSAARASRQSRPRWARLPARGQRSAQ